MSSKLRDTLRERLDANYMAFIASLQEKTVSELLAMAPEITAAQQLHEELLNACDEDDAAFLLRFDDPLEVMRGYWESEITGYDGSKRWEAVELLPSEQEMIVGSMEEICQNDMGKSLRDTWADHHPAINRKNLHQKKDGRHHHER